MADGIINEKEDEFLDNKDEDLEPVGNPAPPTDVDLDLLRGDRIGDTVYSGKWCIQTVMKMLQSNTIMMPEEGEQQQTEDGKIEVVDMEEELQNEVGVLWDMTSNVEVCQYLQSVGAIESIYHIINKSRCPRATEMCVGMLGNIVTHDELWQSLQSDTTLFAILIPLFTSTDQPVLLELSRFFTTAMSHSELSHCYGSMCSNGALITQELVRILSGSTNCDLLKQTTELTHILMCVDKDDSHFNALFAHPDFIAAVLEASKEIGYVQETSSQSCIMEILHGFTTYPAGITAMETCMGPITDAISKYLRSLCHNINLSNSGDTISIIITLLNHIFCRSLEVRMDLISSSKLLQNILKILIALYRRLGLYDAIANSAKEDHHHHRHHHHHHHHKHHKHHHHRQHKKQSSTEEEHHSKGDKSATATEPWESSANVEEDEEEDEEGKSARRGFGEKSEPKSWSERAGQGEETPKHIFATPDPSPKHQGHAVMKEVEFLSWSERRMASPLVDGVLSGAGGSGGGGASGDIWKIPQETRKLKKKTMSMEKMEKEEDCDGVTSSVSSTMAMKMDGGKEDEKVNMDDGIDDASKPVADGTHVFGPTDGGDEDTGNTDSMAKPDSTCDEEKHYEVKGIEMEASRHSTDSHRSGGFSPSLGNDDEELVEGEKENDESMECENDHDVKGKCEANNESGKRGEKASTSTIGGGEDAGISHTGSESPSSTMQFTNGIDNDASNDDDNNGGNGDDEEMFKHTRTQKISEREDDEERIGGDAEGMHGDEGGLPNNRERRPSHRSNLSKYQTLLKVVREFLSDFFNNFREGLLTEHGNPVITDVITFLDSQCRRSTLHIVVDCVGPSHDVATPVGRLIHLSECLNARNLHSVLVDFVGRKERQRI